MVTTTPAEHVRPPPAPPTMQPRLHLPRSQRIALLLFALPPALALAGVFDAHEARIERRVGPLEVVAEVPRRVRENRYATLRIDLVNRGPEATHAEVAISPEYLRDAITVTMTPTPHRAWATHVGPIAPGERARVTLELQAEGAGPHEGVLRVRDRGGDEARVEISTFVFP